MKNFLNTLYQFGISIGQARAASSLARAGYYREAQALYNK